MEEYVDIEIEVIVFESGNVTTITPGDDTIPTSNPGNNNNDNGYIGNLPVVP